MNLRRLEFTLTTKCNSQCIYCQADASLFKKDVMDVADAHNYLMEATKVSKLKSFMVFGGEPMLYPERALDIFSKAQELKIPKIDMLTNGTWGKSKKTSDTLAKKLETAGLNVLGVSVDAFHQQYIPLEYPRNAAQSAMKADIEQVTWNVAVIESIDATNRYDRKTKKILKSLEDTGIEAHIHMVAPVGRATKTLRRYFQTSSFDGACEGEEPIGNALTDPDSICIEPSGLVDICWRLPIGNAKTSPLSQILNNYDWRKDEIRRTLVKEGPEGLLKLAEEHHCRIRKKQYVGKCHMCMEIRQILKRYYPNAYHERS